MFVRPTTNGNAFQWTRRFAGTLAALYVALALSASFCQFGHAGTAGESHHHTHKATHSVLCAWACQATSATLAGQVTFSGSPILVVLGLPAVPAESSPCRHHNRSDARAPPIA
jgi:hypothetical protein